MKEKITMAIMNNEVPNVSELLKKGKEAEVCDQS